MSAERGSVSERDTSGDGWQDHLIQVARLLNEARRSQSAEEINQLCEEAERLLAQVPPVPCHQAANDNSIEQSN